MLLMLPWLLISSSVISASATSVTSWHHRCVFSNFDVQLSHKKVSHCCINVVVCPSVCMVVSEWQLSLQQPQEKQLLEQAQELHAAGRSPLFQPHAV